MFDRLREDSHLARILRQCAPECVDLGLPSLNSTATGHVSMLDIDTSKIQDPIKQKNVDMLLDYCRKF